MAKVTTAQRSAGRSTLTRERVLRAAIELADEHGLDALSMRRLGQALGVEAMSLYTHVSGKDDLIDGMVDVVAGEFALPAAAGEWTRAMRDAALSQHEVLVRHPWACAELTTRTIGRSRLRHADATIAVLDRSGLSAQQAHSATHAIDGLIYGYTLQELSYPSRDFGAEVRAIHAHERDAEYPHLSAMLAAVRHDDQAEFEFALDLLLDGLARAVEL